MGNLLVLFPHVILTQQSRSQIFQLEGADKGQ